MMPDSKGFTFIEMLLVLVLSAVAAAIALPNLGGWRAKARAANQAQQLANLLQYARGEAARLNLTVYVCPAQIRVDGRAQGHCRAENRAQGLTAFADANQNRLYDDDTRDLSLRTVILNANLTQGEAPKNTYRYQSCSAGGSCADTDDLVWAYYPDGAFGYGSRMGAQARMAAAGRLRVIVSDARADGSDAAARSAVVVIDAGGRAEVCAKNDERAICRHPD
ncbi:GspH/FimT family pseudopilin [Bergeriella denitrificans]|uniref:Type II secretion system protein H n=1 Tax=Bergeriella denitrificans TaxID=494 RepID=A0A378UJS6_BERDE|nr:GspH/FimT family pseudopilin [Bergeriella denitrificans]STZ76741.1 fimbrial protein FimT [Bergeriella denitrificans]